ncbi:hypothetical protein Pth03_81890 [Planotetraspora thailandica]|uniref:Uncharacterized protein n=1 Tax=Planotetraspora thailandica TaxID=487172 RepID=A0A8J3Y341_9ACTN|nr:hypothetical protein [Planotetraspora thailandica]GII59800.1 hypothetical protein Pth03_81890 [Planotetraspora thailandica]
MAQVKCRALISLLSSEEGGLSRELPSRTQSLVIRVSYDDHPEHGRPFSAEITADDDEPLAPGDKYHIVTMAFREPEAARYFHPGDRFALWFGHGVGRGIVSRRVVA